MKGRFKNIEDVDPNSICCKAFRDELKETGGVTFEVARPHAVLAVRACSRCGFVSGEQPFLWIWSRDKRRVVAMPVEFMDLDEGEQ